MNIQEFIQQCQNKQIQLDAQQLHQFEQYANYLVVENEKINLTAITEISEIYEKHFYDCLLISNVIKDYQSICDVGSGAGFPGVVLAIANPQCHFTLIEPLNKRCQFLFRLVEKLGLTNVDVVNIRAEEAKQYRESFDVVTARAVANLSMLSELCAPLVKVDGLFIAMKGNKGKEELEISKQALGQLGLKLIEIKEEHLVSEFDTRLNMVLKKVKQTPLQFPRKFASIKKKPL